MVNRRKVFCIAGMPGSGKSSLIVKFLEAGDFEATQPYKLVPAEYSPGADLYVLGVYEAGLAFPGSDKMSLAAQPMAIEFANSTKSNIMVEGDRLSTISFFEAILENDDIDFEIIYIETSPEILRARYNERGSNQDEKFLKGRETKYKNILNKASLEPFIKKFRNDTLKDQEEILAYIEKRSRMDPHTPKVKENSLEELM